MALSLPFTMEDLYDEFGALTAPTKPCSFRTDIYEYIIGTPSSGGRLSDFAGYGRPSFSSFTISTADTLGGYIDIDFTVNVGSLTTTLVVQYALDTGTPPGSWTTYGTYNYSSNGTYNIEFPVPNTSDDYFVRVRAYNKFTSSDFIYPNASGAAGTVVQSSAPATDPLQLTNLTFIATTVLGEEWVHTWNYSSSTGTFALEVSINGGAFSSADCAIIDLVYEGADVWSGKFDLNIIPTIGDPIIFRIKRSGTTEPWTSTQEFNYKTVEEQNASQPTINTLSVDNIDTEGGRFRMDVSAFDDVAGQEYEYWWEYKETTSGTWLSTSKQTASTTGTKTLEMNTLDPDTEYDVRAKAQNTLSATVITDTTGVTFTTDHLAYEPQNFQAVDNFVQHDLSWNDPQAGNPTTDYEIQWWDGSNWNILDLNVSATANTYTSNQTTATKYRIRSNFGGTFSSYVEATV